MGETTKIQWASRTFSPWFGCSKVHTGCANCYAEADNKRYARNGGLWGPGAPRQPRADAGWREPLKWARAAAARGERERVFPSLCDPLDEEAPPDAQKRFWQLIRDTSPRCARAFTEGVHGDAPESMDGGTCAECGGPFGGLTFLLLTKRPELWTLIPEDIRPFVWLGTSVSDQETADKWVPRLLEADGFRLRFLSIEPLVGPVDLSSMGPAAKSGAHGWGALNRRPDGAPRIDWVIVGGESGPRARSCRIDWVRSLVHQCAAAQVPCFVKQLGAKACSSVIHNEETNEDEWWHEPFADPKGGDPSEWAEDLRVRQLPEVTHVR